jgi:predicted Zn-dependent protease
LQGAEGSDFIESRMRDLGRAVPYWSLRSVDARQETLAIRRGVVQPPKLWQDQGCMISVIEKGGQGYAATSDFSESGLREALERARTWAQASAGRAVTDFQPPLGEPQRAEYESPVRTPWHTVSLAEKLDLLRSQSQQLQGSGEAGRDAIVDWEATLWWSEEDSTLVDSRGERIEQRFRYLIPMMSASANRGSETQTRSFGGHAFARQGGLEVLEDVGFERAAGRLPAQARELVAAPSCPEGQMDLILAPDQMILQIHESIGHPIELDRILGDERNYAGTSFVTPDMFGSYPYGSELLNVSFDPTRSEQLASYAFDDEGAAASREPIIQNGILMRPLGGASSQARAGLPGVANARSCSWNRAPIDRMANLNLEPGDATLCELIGRVSRGVYMETNCSWSIDDSRNKFQFGCEWGRVIEDGELKEVVKKPGYRGISATFWRSLAGVGNAASVEVMGTPYCGKGEPNQAIRVGHASPPCLFRDVEVFGGE